MTFVCSLTKIFTLYFFIAIVVTALRPFDSIKGKDKLVPMSQDPFYKPPPGYENAEPGTILRIRVAPSRIAAFAKYPQNVKGAWQILYSTTDALGQPDAAVTTLMAPFNADTKKLVSYHVINDSVSVNCTASSTLQLGATANNFLTQPEIMNVDQMLHHGWYVSVPNYGGSQSMYTVGLMVAHGVLDSIRAVLASSPLTNLSSDAQIQMWGYSGGAMASAWAAQEQDRYAPELNIIGAAMGGTPVSLNATINAINKKLFAGLILTGIMALTRQYPELDEYVDSVIRPEYYDDYIVSGTLCLEGLMAKFAMHDIHQYMLVPDYLDQPIANRTLNANVLGNAAVPKIPMYMFHAVHDDVVPFQSFYPLYEKWCAGGANIQLTKEGIGIHVSTMVTGFPAALNYMVDVFEGKATPTGCQSVTPINSLTWPRAMRMFRKIFRDGFQFMKGKPIGPNTQKT